MATEADICNLALAQLGDSATVTSIKPPDGSPQAGKCARWWPIALRQVTEAHDWSFLTKRVKLAALASLDDELYTWKYGFNVPSDCVRIIKVERKTHCGMETVSFETERNEANSSRMILCNAKEPILSYVAYNTNPSIFPGYFISCLVPLLASYLVGPLKRSDSMTQTAQNLRAEYLQALSLAKTMDAKISVHKRRRPPRIPPHLRAREV